MAIKFGIEEEVFLIERDKPGIDSLYPLFRLLRENPGFYYVHTAANIARGKEILEFPVISVEISTGIADSVNEAISQLSAIRKDLSRNCPQKILATGILPHKPSAEKAVCGLHVHLSGDFDLNEARAKIIRYLPALLLITANSPSLDNGYLSNRVLCNPYVGPVIADPYERFQDIIISRRLNTLEIRVFDPVPWIERYRILLKAIKKIIEKAKATDFDLQNYEKLRTNAAKYGISDKEVQKLVAELAELTEVDLIYFEKPPALETRRLFDELGTGEAIKTLDLAYREGVAYSGEEMPRTLRAAAGFFGYYLPKVPYITYKFLKEHGYL